MSDKPLTNAAVKLSGLDGNAFFIIGHVKSGIMKSNHPELADQFYKEATSGDYDHLIVTCMKYVEVL